MFPQAEQAQTQIYMVCLHCFNGFDLIDSLHNGITMSKCIEYHERRDPHTKCVILIRWLLFPVPVSKYIAHDKVGVYKENVAVWASNPNSLINTCSIIQGLCLSFVLVLWSEFVLASQCKCRHNRLQEYFIITFS